MATIAHISRKPSAMKAIWRGARFASAGSRCASAGWRRMIITSPSPASVATSGSSAWSPRKPMALNQRCIPKSNATKARLTQMSRQVKATSPIGTRKTINWPSTASSDGTTSS